MGRLEVGSPLDTISLGQETFVAAPLLACLLISLFVCLTQSVFHSPGSLGTEYENQTELELSDPAASVSSGLRIRHEPPCLASHTGLFAVCLLCFCFCF